MTHNILLAELYHADSRNISQNTRSVLQAAVLAARQIYLRDIYAEVARPVKELKGFDRIFLKKGEGREVKFVLTEDDLKFYNSGLQYIYEPGEFDVMIGTNSRDVQTKRFIAE